MIPPSTTMRSLHLLLVLGALAAAAASSRTDDATAEVRCGFCPLLLGELLEQAVAALAADEKAKPTEGLLMTLLEGEGGREDSGLCATPGWLPIWAGKFEVVGGKGSYAVAKRAERVISPEPWQSTVMRSVCATMAELDVEIAAELFALLNTDRQATAAAGEKAFARICSRITGCGKIKRPRRNRKTKRATKEL